MQRNKIFPAVLLSLILFVPYMFVKGEQAKEEHSPEIPENSAGPGTDPDPEDGNSGEEESNSPLIWQILYDLPDEDWSPIYCRREYPAEKESEECRQERLTINDDDHQSVRLTVETKYRVEIIRIRAQQHLQHYRLVLSEGREEILTVPRLVEPVRQTYSFFPLNDVHHQPAASNPIDIRIICAISHMTCYTRKAGALHRVCSSEGCASSESNYPGITHLEGLQHLITLVSDSQAVDDPAAQVSAGQHDGLQTDLTFERVPSYCQLSQCSAQQKIHLGDETPWQAGDVPLAVFIHQHFQINNAGEDEYWTEVYLISGPLTIAEALPDGEEATLMPEEPVLVEEQGGLLDPNGSEDTFSMGEWPEIGEHHEASYQPPSSPATSLEGGAVIVSDSNEPTSESSQGTQEKADAEQEQVPGSTVVVHFPEVAQAQPVCSPEEGGGKKKKKKKSSSKAEQQAQSTVVPEWDVDMSGYRVFRQAGTLRTYLKLVMLLKEARPALHQEWLDAHRAKSSEPDTWEYYDRVLSQVIQQIEQIETKTIPDKVSHRVITDQEIYAFLIAADRAIEKDARSILEQRITELSSAPESDRQAEEQALYRQMTQYLTSVFRARVVALLINKYFKGHRISSDQDVYRYIENQFTMKLLDGLQSFSSAIQLCESCRLPLNLRFLILSVMDKDMSGWIASRVENGTLASENALAILETLWPEAAVAGLLDFQESVRGVLVITASSLSKDLIGHDFFQSGDADPQFELMHRFLHFVFMLVKSSENLRIDSHDAAQASALIIGGGKMVLSLISHHLKKAYQDFTAIAGVRKEELSQVNKHLQAVISLMGRNEVLKEYKEAILDELLGSLRSGTEKMNLIAGLSEEIKRINKLDTEAIKKHHASHAAAEGQKLIVAEEARKKKEADKAEERRKKAEDYRKRIMEEAFEKRKKKVEQKAAQVEEGPSPPASPVLPLLDQKLIEHAHLLPGLLRIPFPTDEHIKNVLDVYKGLVSLARTPLEQFRIHALVADAYHSIARHQNAGKAASISEKISDYEREVDKFLAGKNQKGPGKEAKDAFWELVVQFANIVTECSSWLVQERQHIVTAYSHLEARELEDQKGFLDFAHETYDEMNEWIADFRLAAERIQLTSKKVVQMLRRLGHYGKDRRGGRRRDRNQSREAQARQLVEAEIQSMEDALQTVTTGVKTDIHSMQFNALQLHDMTVDKVELGKASAVKVEVEVSVSQKKNSQKHESLHTLHLDDKTLTRLLAAQGMALVPIAKDHNCYFEALLAGSGRNMDQQTLRTMLVIILRMIRDKIMAAEPDEKKTLIIELSNLMGAADNGQDALDVLENLINQEGAFIAGGSESYWGNIHFSPFMVLALHSSIVQWLPGADGQLISHSISAQSWEDSPGLLQLLQSAGFHLPDSTAPEAHIVHNGANHFHSAVVVEQQAAVAGAASQATENLTAEPNPDDDFRPDSQSPGNAMLVPAVLMLNLVTQPSLSK